jgi:hypothetical protein
MAFLMVVIGVLPLCALVASDAAYNYKQCRGVVRTMNNSNIRIIKLFII